MNSWEICTENNLLICYDATYYGKKQFVSKTISDSINKYANLFHYFTYFRHLYSEFFINGNVKKQLLNKNFIFFILPEINTYVGKRKKRNSKF